MTIDPAAPDSAAPERRTPARQWVVLGIAGGLVVGLGLGLLVAWNGSGNTARDVSGAAPATVTVTESVTATVTEAPAVAEAPSADTTGSDTSRSATTVLETPVPETAASAAEPSAAGITEPIGPVGDLARRINGDPLARGAVDAPVVMVMYSDYRCPFCAMFSTDIEPALVDQYVADGRMRIEWRDFPIFGEESQRAAVAGRAAAAQGRFWEFVTALYAAALRSGHPELRVKELIDFARQAGVADIDAFTAAMEDAELAAAVQADYDEGSRIGVPATPSFVINGYPVRGAQPVAEFVRIIDLVLAAQGGI